MRDELPQGWIATRLDEIVAKQKGKKPAVVRKDPSPGFVPYIDIHAIEKGVIREFAEAKSSKIAGVDDLFVVWDGARSGWVGHGMVGAIGSTIMSLTLCEIVPLYLKNFIAGQFQNINTQTKGTGIPHVDPDVFFNLEVPLAPLNEQHRIVVKLDQLLPKVQGCQDRLEKIPRILKRFRQSVLAAACSNDFDLVPFSNIGTVSGGLTKNGKRDSLKIQMPYLRVANVYTNELRLEEIKFIGVAKSEIQRTLLNLNDLLIVEGNGSLDQIGRVALWGGSIPDCLHQNHLIKFRSSNKVLPQFLLLWMMSPQGREKIQEVASSTTGLHTLSISKIENLQIPLPPLPKQQEIVRRVEALFKLADQIEVRYQKAKASVDKLTQSILAKAFRGELVSQDPNDEPAEELFKRIRAKKEKQGPEKPSKKRKQRLAKAHISERGAANG